MGIYRSKFSMKEENLGWKSKRAIPIPRVPKQKSKVKFNLMDKTINLDHQSNFEMREEVKKEMKIPPFQFRCGHFPVPVRPSSARLVLHVQPEFKDDEKFRRPWVTIDYCFNRVNEKSILTANGKEIHLECLLPMDPRYMDHPDLLNNNKDTTPLNIFFSSIRYILNHLEGEIWWNGFQIKLSGKPLTRMELIAYEMDPFRLVFQLNTLRQVDIIRKNRSLTLIGYPLKQWVPLRKFHIQGRNSPNIRVINPKDGTVVLNFPPYSQSDSN